MGAYYAFTVYISLSPPRFLTFRRPWILHGIVYNLPWWTTYYKICTRYKCTWGTTCIIPNKALYRVSHSKVSKVILLWWGYRFRFMLIFWILPVHGIGAFMPNSSVFIFLMLRALYRMISKNPKFFFSKSSLNVTNVKLLSNFFFNDFLIFANILDPTCSCDRGIYAQFIRLFLQDDM